MTENLFYANEIKVNYYKSMCVLVKCINTLWDSTFAQM